MATLYQLNEEMASIEAILEENGGELTPELQTAWEETRDSLKAKVDNYNALIQKLVSQSEMADKEMKRLKAIKETADKSVKRLKEHLLDSMYNFGLDKLEGNYCKMSIRNNKPSVEVCEEVLTWGYKALVDDVANHLPPYLSLEIKVSKTELMNIYKEKGVLPEGSELMQTKSLTIK